MSLKTAAMTLLVGVPLIAIAAGNMQNTAGLNSRAVPQLKGSTCTMVTEGRPCNHICRTSYDAGKGVVAS
jgi:hypothetical protein